MLKHNSCLQFSNNLLSNVNKALKKDEQRCLDLKSSDFKALFHKSVSGCLLRISNFTRVLKRATNLTLHRRKKSYNNKFANKYKEHVVFHKFSERWLAEWQKIWNTWMNRIDRNSLGYLEKKEWKRVWEGWEMGGEGGEQTIEARSFKIEMPFGE